MKNRLVARIAMVIIVCAIPLAVAACGTNTVDMATFCRDARTMENHYKAIDNDDSGVTPAVMAGIAQQVGHLSDEAPGAIKAQLAELSSGLQSYAAGRLDDPALTSAGSVGDSIDRYLSVHCNLR